MPANKPKQPDEKYPLRLTEKQRESLVHATRLKLGLKTRIEETSKDQQFVEFTKKELVKMGDEIHTSLAFAPSVHARRLKTVLGRIADLLDDLDEKHLKEKRQSVDRSGLIYQFKVTLNGSNPPIWRRIHVPDCTLGELHEVLQVVMGWEESHLHRFMIQGKYYRPIEPEDCLWDMEKYDEEVISISQVVKMGRRTWFTYEYDFRDGWQHRIVLEKTLEPEPKVKYPRCIEGARACPPENVGGIKGFINFLEAINDPRHESHEDTLRWIGGKFDAESFSVDKVNMELRRHF